MIWAIPTLKTRNFKIIFYLPKENKEYHTCTQICSIQNSAQFKFYKLLPSITQS